MSINWHNIERLRTRDGRKVVGCVPYDDCGLARWAVVVRNYDGFGVQVYRAGGDGVVFPVESNGLNDIIELPPEPPAPREVVRWVHSDVFHGCDGCGVWKNATGSEFVRVRIIEEPEVKP